MHHSRTRPVPNFTRLDPGRPEVAILMEAMPRIREVVAARPWSTSQEPTSECWWADVLADPRARHRPAARRLHRDRGSTAGKKAYYILADEPQPTILVAAANVPGKQRSAALAIASEASGTARVRKCTVECAWPAIPIPGNRLDRGRTHAVSYTGGWRRAGGRCGQHDSRLRNRQDRPWRPHAFGFLSPIRRIL